jgi:hypothetical protein
MLCSFHVDPTFNSAQLLSILSALVKLELLAASSSGKPFDVPSQRHWTRSIRYLSS